MKFGQPFSRHVFPRETQLVETFVVSNLLNLISSPALSLRKMNELLMLATVLLVCVTISGAYLQVDNQPEVESFPEPLWPHLKEELEQPSGNENGKCERLAVAIS